MKEQTVYLHFFFFTKCGRSHTENNNPIPALAPTEIRRASAPEVPVPSKDLGSGLARESAQAESSSPEFRKLQVTLCAGLHQVILAESNSRAHEPCSFPSAVSYRTSKYLQFIRTHQFLPSRASWYCNSRISGNQDRSIW